MKGRGKGAPLGQLALDCPRVVRPSLVFNHLFLIVDFARYQDHDSPPLFIDRCRVIRDCQKR